MESDNNKGESTLAKIKEVTEKVVDYRISLGRIEAALVQDPGNRDLIILRKDLIEVVNSAQNELTELHKSMKPNESNPTPTSPPPVPEVAQAQSEFKMEVDADHDDHDDNDDYQEDDQNDDFDDDDAQFGEKGQLLNKQQRRKQRQKDRKKARKERWEASHQYLCPFCTVQIKRFASEETLDLHLQNKHPTEDEHNRKYICPICTVQRKYVTAEHLTVHMRSKHSDKEKKGYTQDNNESITEEKPSTSSTSDNGQQQRYRPSPTELNAARKYMNEQRDMWKEKKAAEKIARDAVKKFNRPYNPPGSWRRRAP